MNFTSTIRCYVYNQTYLRGHQREGQNTFWLLKIGDPVKQVQLHCILVQGIQKMWLLKIGDPLIQVAT